MNKNIYTALLALIISTTTLWYFAKRQKAHENYHEQLIVGTNSDYYPYSFISDDKIQGFDIDLIEEVAKRLDKKITLQDMPFDALIPAAQIGQIQVIAAGITSTPERAERIIFTEPYLQQDPLLIVSPKEHAITSINELENKTAVVNEGYMADLYMSQKPGVDLLRLATPTEAFLALESGRADAFIAARNSVKAFFDKHGTDKFSIVEIPDASDSYSFAISPKYQELLEPIQKALNDIKREGVLQLLLEKWKLN
ncbi:basic amino acid ABC transporter substrate-binding protein [Candidatus Dependentiae bacterium Noda2021]|nr:basic amino acid ABC transporter substrate-binding protein [Candidatus Dependentiae bacterium Noda2021]